MMLFVISGGVVESKNSFRFQIEYLAVVKEKSVTLCYMGGSLQTQIFMCCPRDGFHLLL